MGEHFLLWRFLHLLGVILWVGGTTAAALVVALVPDGARPATARAARRIVLYLGTPGLLLAFGAGLAQLLPYWSTLYAKAGWMHGKLTVVLLAAAVTGIITGQLRRIGASDPATPLSAGKVRGYALALLVLSTLALALVLYRFGART